MGHPMKVSEAVERLQQEITLSGPHAQIVVVKIEDLTALLASHEALRLAGDNLANAADVVGVAYFDSDDMPEEAEAMQAATLEWRALSLAVEDASK